MHDRLTTGYRTINRMARLGGAVIAALAMAGAASAANTLRVGQGETFATIAAAVAAASAGDTILITTNVQTEFNITVSKSVTIAGLGMTSTIVQAANTRSNVASGRIFNVTGSPAIADGKLYLRLTDGIACYDLRAK